MLNDELCKSFSSDTTITLNFRLVSYRFSVGVGFNCCLVGVGNGGF